MARVCRSDTKEMDWVCVTVVPDIAGPREPATRESIALILPDDLLATGNARDGRNPFHET